MLPLPTDWPDAPCSLLQLSPAYDAAARLARARGWPVLTLDGAGHFAALTDPHRVAGALLDLLSS